MRKVYHNEKSRTGLAVALFVGVGITAILFGIIPFSHIIAKPRSLVQLRSVSTADLPAPTENELPPVVTEPEKKEETPPELKLADAPQQIALSADLEVAVGSGGALAGFGEVQKLAATEAAREEAFDVSELEKRPEPVSQVAPTYPSELRKAKIEGLVTLVFLLSEEGRVEDPRIENSSRPEFEKPALEAIRKWRFRPGVKEGQPVRTYIRIPMRFRVTSG
jgi:periplasmic protein TonB